MPGSRRSLVLVACGGLLVLAAVAIVSLPLATGTVLLSEDFSTDPNTGSTWDIYRWANTPASEAVWSSTGNYLSLTTGGAYKGAAIVPASANLPGSSWNMTFRYWVDGASGGADGITFVFYKDTTYLSSGQIYGSAGIGASPGPSGGNYGNHAGYAVVIDNFGNTWDPAGTSLSVVGASDWDLRGSDYSPFPQAEDGQWHTLVVDHCSSSIRVYSDGVLRLTDAGPFATTYQAFGFTAGTGSASHEHRIDDILLTDCGAVMPPPPPPPPAPPSPPPPPPAPAALAAEAGGPYIGSTEASLAIAGYGIGGASPYRCSWAGFPGLSGTSTCAFPFTFDRPARFLVELCVTDRQGMQACDLAEVIIHEVVQDSDLDGVVDDADNCVSVPNHGQDDRDHNGLGDACEEQECRSTTHEPRTCGDPEAQEDLQEWVVVDTDGDGIVDSADNCPSLANHGQDDMDGDQFGDVCDEDVDGDGRINEMDVCPRMPNPDNALAGEPCALLGSKARGAAGQPTGVGQLAVDDVQAQMPRMGWVALGFACAGVAVLLFFAWRQRKN